MFCFENSACLFGTVFMPCSLSKFKYVHKVNLFFSCLFLGIDQNEYAIKAIRKDKGYTREVATKLIELEVQTMLNLGSHPNIVNIFDSNTNGVARLPVTGLEEVKYIALEKCANGSLSKYIRNTGPLEEQVTRFFFLQLWNAVSFMHEQHYVHLDIKLDNILLDDFFNVKLGDLGIALCAKNTSGYIAHRRGTPKYMAPEVEKASDKAPFNVFSADIYSLGVCLHLLLFGEYPESKFNEEKVPTENSSNESDETMSDNESKECSIKDSISLSISESWLDLLEDLLNVNPHNRPAISKILSHPWLNQEVNESLIEMVYLEMSERSKFMKNPKKQNILPFEESDGEFNM